MDWATQLPAVLVAVLLVVKWSYDAIAKRGNIEAQPNPLPLMSKQISDLHDWHNKDDEDGVKLWYVRRSMEDAILKLSDNVEKQTQMLDKHYVVLDRVITLIANQK